MASAKDIVQLEGRDVVLSDTIPEPTPPANLYLGDLLRLYRIIHLLEHPDDNITEAADAKPMATAIFNILAHGKQFELAGLKDVPSAFLAGPGRCVQAQEDGTYAIMSEEDSKAKLMDLIVQEFTQPLGVDLQDIPYKDLQLSMQKPLPEADASLAVDHKDAVLVPARHLIEQQDKLYESQGGNKAIFNLASQLVTTYTTNSAKRVEAALAILKGLSEAEVIEEDKDTKAATVVKSNASRFLFRSASQDLSPTPQMSWTILKPQDAAEFTLGFCFEVYLEKGIHLITNTLEDQLPASYSMAHQMPPGEEPITITTDGDVLFGRGGMTNSHPGNRRFRDIIALHRPDYVRAIKMDKPAVARKIVQAIRSGNPPGRFLRKNEEGKWIDVGDRAAAEKTSQGLRERSNAEKRQRANLREVLRTRQAVNEEEDGVAIKPKKIKITNADLAAAGVGGSEAPVLNYVGTNLAVPLSLGMMKEPPAKNTVKKREGGGDLNTEGLPPNAVDEDGNILVTDYDILCGRGGLTNHHKGNKRFRDIVALHRPDYVRAPKIQKPSVARVIVRAIRNGDPPGRFLRKDDKTGQWIDIGDKKASEKTSQALREKTDEERERIKREGAAGELPKVAMLPKASVLPNELLTPAMLSTASEAATAAVNSDKPEAEDVKMEDVADAVADVVGAVEEEAETVTIVV